MRNAGVWALSFVLGVTGLFLAEGQQSPTQACLSLRPEGDWVCVNGGWFPVGHPGIPASTPSPSPSPPAPPLALPNACATSDPFAGARGRFSLLGLFGVCVDGGWVPIGHPLATEYLGRPLPVDYSGTYTLTILTGDCSVEIPEVFKRRVYTAHVLPNGATLGVSLTGADFLPGSNSFSGLVVSANEIRFDITGFTDSFYSYYSGGAFFDVAENVAGVGTIFVSTGFPIIATTDISGARVNGAFSQNDGFLGLAVPSAFPGFLDTAWQCPISSFELVRQ